MILNRVNSSGKYLNVLSASFNSKHKIRNNELFACLEITVYNYGISIFMHVNPLNKF